MTMRRPAKPPASFDPAMDLYLETCTQRIIDLRGWVLGLYAEAVVAEALGAQLSARGNDDVDLTWNPPCQKAAVTVQVRMRHLGDDQASGSFGISPRNGHHRALGDIWVFARHIGDSHQEGWAFVVRSAKELDRRYRTQQTISHRRLAHTDEWVDRSALPLAARDCVKGTRA